MLWTAILLASCTQDAQDSGGPWVPDVVACPGGPGCEDADGPLRAGAAAVDITPRCYESWLDLDDNATYSRSKDEVLDCGCDRLCEGDPGYPGPDEGEGDGAFQATWMAGFGNSRPAQGSHDPIWARALVVEQGSSRVAIVSVDLVGFFRTDTERVREAALALDIDHVIVSATHAHEGPDMMGIWGRTVTESGYVPEYADQVRADIHLALTQAVDALEPVEQVSVGAAQPEAAHTRGAANLIADTRDPVVVPPDLGVLHLQGASGTIATLINWGCHPETLADDNLQISSDFAHALRQTVESGSSWDAYETQGVGGVAIYVQGMVGGMMTTLRVSTETPDGETLTGDSFEHTDAIGTLLGELALQALDDAQPMDDPDLSFSARTLELPVANIAFQAMFRLDVFPDRELVNYDDTIQLDEDNMPDIVTEVDVLRLGDLTLVTIPGELLPEAGIGGYDGAFTPGAYDLIDPGNVNPPDLSSAPEGPYLIDEMGPHAWIIGLGNDELGYIIPPYDFELGGAPYLDQADGDHYEETNSLGPDTEPLIRQAALELLSWDG